MEQMSNRDTELRILKHYADFAPQLNLPNLASRRYFLHQAQSLHTWSVLSALQDSVLKVVNLSNEAKPSKARNYLLYGVGRRLNSIWLAFRNLHNLIPPNRIESLGTDEAISASNELNSIYINVRGALDNFAWCLQYTFVGKDLPPSEVGLFLRKFQQQQGLEAVKLAVKDFADWDKDFKSKRDPAAHRIPLLVLPAIHDATSLSVVQELEKKIALKTIESRVASVKKNYEVAILIAEEVEELRMQREKLGNFYPKFEFDPATGPIDLYPTVPEDLGIFVIISRRLCRILEKEFGNCC
jgi:hypothetical protein